MQGAIEPACPLIHLRRWFRAPPEKIFRAWTQPETLRAWWCPSGWRATLVEVDLRAGGAYRIGMRQEGPCAEIFVSGHFLEVLPPRLLRYTWRWEGAFEQMPDTLVTVEFIASRSGTELILRHANFEDAGVRQDHWIGWVAACNRMERSLPVA
ncbi:MAG: SRPBCC domain-containing protein [Alphaproteobacteria bacterium]|nr:SRPBCC domain-containing protein [Alphaproteobacteria bacterium]